MRLRLDVSNGDRICFANRMLCAAQPRVKPRQGRHILAGGASHRYATKLRKAPKGRHTVDKCAVRSPGAWCEYLKIHAGQWISSVLCRPSGAVRCFRDSGGLRHRLKYGAPPGLFRGKPIDAGSVQSGWQTPHLRPLAVSNEIHSVATSLMFIASIICVHLRPFAAHPLWRLISPTILSHRRELYRPKDYHRRQSLP